MRSEAIFGRRAALAAALFLGPALWACESGPTSVDAPRPRIFRVAMANGQILPAHQECPAPVAGMVTGTHFVEGELILYPERTFTWRYTIQQYAAMEGMEQAWVEPTTVQGTYDLAGDSLHFLTAGTISRKGRMHGDRVTLGESVPCHFPVEGHTPPTVELDLAPVKPEA